MLKAHLLTTRFIFILFVIGLTIPGTPARGGSGSDGLPADLVLVNGRVVTVDDRYPEGEALAIRADTIIAVGTDADIREFIGETTRVIDLAGRIAIPGFIDSHAHFLSLGTAKMRLDLTTARSWEEIVAMVAEAARTKPAGEWILGRGWHQEKWLTVPEPNVDGLPYHDALSAVSPDNPVMLVHASGHSSIANARAMELAGVTVATRDPDGGEIVRDEKGSAIGVFRETAETLLDSAYERSQADRSAQEIEAEKTRAIDLATRECLSHGVTSLHDAGASFETIDLYRRLADRGGLGIRLWVMIGEENDSLRAKLADYRIIGAGDNRLTVRAVKQYIDGALGSHGAWLLEPYEDLSLSTGMNTEATGTLRETARLAFENSFQLCIHAIGDRGNREVLNIYEETFAAHPDSGDRRWRVEHAQHLDPDDIPRFGELGVIAAMQGIHCTSDGPWVPKRIGLARAEAGAYAWQKLLRSGAIICNGTDAPVEDVDPIANFYALVTRRLPDGSSFYPGQRLSRDEALKTYTINGAYAAFEEDIKGSLTPGKLADVVVLSGDITTVPEDDIPGIKVVYTIIGGKVVYEGDEAD